MEWFTSGLLTALPPLIPAVLGWVIIIKNGVKLAKRGEIHTLCGSTQKSLMDLIKHAEETWKEYEDLLDEVAENNLTLMIANLELSLGTISKYYFPHSVTLEEIFKLRYFCTISTAVLGMNLNIRMNEIRNAVYAISNTLHVESYEFSHERLTIWGASLTPQ